MDRDIILDARVKRQAILPSNADVWGSGSESSGSGENYDSESTNEFNGSCSSSSESEDDEEQEQEQEQAAACKPVDRKPATRRRQKAAAEKHDDGDAHESDDEPLSSLIQPPAQNFSWTKQPTAVQVPPFTRDFSEPPENDESPMQYFSRFLNDNDLREIVRLTNLYAARHSRSFRTDLKEMRRFFGVLLLIGIVHMPHLRMYWANETRYDMVADCITRNRFEELLANLSFVDNAKVITNRQDPAYDPLHKIRTFLNRLRGHCLEIEPEEKQSIDEQLIPFKGAHHLKQYLPKKPKKWGFKIYARCGVSGITYDFLFYDGRSVEPNIPVPSASRVEHQPAKVVLKLCETLPLHQNFKVYFDNYFTFLELQLALKDMGIWSVGTLRANRLRDCPLKAEAELKKAGRGSYDCSFDANSGLSVVRWFDSAAVQLASTHVADQPVSTISRWDKKRKERVDVVCPAVVKDYNQNMGGVDLFDMFSALYRIDHRSRKWYRRIFYWGLNLACINGWLLYRRHQTQEKVKSNRQLDLMSFVMQVSSGLRKVGQIDVGISRRRGRSQTQKSIFEAVAAADSDSEGGVAPAKKRKKAQPRFNPARHDNIAHWPIHAEPKQRCRQCSAYGRTKCRKCDAFLCFTKDRNCFLDYHGEAH